MPSATRTLAVNASPQSSPANSDSSVSPSDSDSPGTRSNRDSVTRSEPKHSVSPVSSSTKQLSVTPGSVPSALTRQIVVASTNRSGSSRNSNSWRQNRSSSDSVTWPSGTVLPSRPSIAVNPVVHSSENRIVPPPNGPSSSGVMYQRPLGSNPARLPGSQSSCGSSLARPRGSPAAGSSVLAQLPLPPS